MGGVLSNPCEADDDVVSTYVCDEELLLVSVFVNLHDSMDFLCDASILDRGVVDGIGGTGFDRFGSEGVFVDEITIDEDRGCSRVIESKDRYRDLGKLEDDREFERHF